MVEIDAMGIDGSLGLLGDAVPWTLLAFASYLATLTLGVFSLRGRRVRRAWHGRLFALSFALTVLAAGIALLRSAFAEGLALVFALVPLALLPFLGTPVADRARRHALVALCAAPCYLAAVALRAAEAP